MAACAVLPVLNQIGPFAFEIPLPAVTLGVIIGLTYGLLAVGIILIYRINGIINFAHGQIGAFGAAIFGLIAVRYHIPYWPAFAATLLLTAGVGTLGEVAVVRRLRNAPTVMTVVATLGLGSFLLYLGLAINSAAPSGVRYPDPTGLPSWSVGALRVTPAYSAMLLLSPVVVVVIALFLGRSRFGLAMRSAAANPEAARMSGIYTTRMSSLAWAIAGALAAFTSILTAPTRGFASVESFGPALLLRAMAAAAIARMTNLPLALAAGATLGIVEQLLLWNYPSSGLVEVALFVIILGSLGLSRKQHVRSERPETWAMLEPLRPLPETLRRVSIIRNLGPIAAVATLLVAVALPAVVSNADSTRLTGIIAFAIVGLSIGILTGLAGQLTLGQFAVGAIGAVVSVFLVRETDSFLLGFFGAIACAGVTSVLVGWPSLRRRGILLTITTLAFALMAPTWLLRQTWMLGDGVVPGRPTVLGVTLDTGRSYYFYALAMLVLAFALAHNVRRSGFRRILVAVRDNEGAARSFTVNAAKVKVQAYFLAGATAGLGGATYAHGLSHLSGSSFLPGASIDVVVMTVVGGITALSGPILGSLFVLGLPAFVNLDAAGLAASKFGLLVLILYLPKGLLGLIEPIRDRLARWIAKRHGIDADAAFDTTDANTGEPIVVRGLATAAGALSFTERSNDDQTGSPVDGKLLDARNLRKHYGGVVAVDNVSLSVEYGEIVGLMGPNGAGKTTTFELLSGFSPIDAGTVLFEGRDITNRTPEQRGKLGLIRSFQDAALFPTLTVTDCLMLAFERTAPTRLTSALTGWGPEERFKRSSADELVAVLGLGHYRNKQVRELSTGTRRICEIGCLLALEPTLLLLDEPSSGLAQRETERLGHLLLSLRALGPTLLVIEHDIPLLTSISDRLIAMCNGSVIAEGTPAEVTADPEVVDAYLGVRHETVQRSNQGPSKLIS